MHDPAAINPALLVLLLSIVAGVCWGLGAAWSHWCHRNRERRAYNQGYTDCEDYIAARTAQIHADEEPAPPLREEFKAEIEARMNARARDAAAELRAAL